MSQKPCLRLITACSLEKAHAETSVLHQRCCLHASRMQNKIWKGNFTLRNVSRFDIVCGMFWNEVNGSELFLFPGLFV